ncbi:MAG: LVIVD repeat-containing protein [Actinomycetota bacterium]
MKKTLASVVAVAALVAAPAARAGIDTGSAGPGPHFASDNVEWVTNVPLAIDSSGANFVGNYMYITTSRDLTIYDISQPESPQRMGFLPLPQQPYFAEEDVDTNGKVLLVGTYPNTLYVIDVEDKSNPVIIGQLAGADQHTWTCVLDCKWAYGSGGLIADLRKPEAPKLAGSWGEGMPAQRGHDVTEVAPGLIVTSTSPIMYLDARKNPAKPKLLAVGDAGQQYVHGNLWPNGGRDKFLLVGGESSGPTCDESGGSAQFMTYDATKVKKSGTFTLIDSFAVKNGNPTEGDAAADLYCGHWFDTHPTYRNGGLVAMAWYEHGTRFLQIDKKGKIDEVGWFLPIAGSTSAAYWIDGEYLYAVDYNRGIDILRFTGKA